MVSPDSSSDLLQRLKELVQDADVQRLDRNTQLKVAQQCRVLLSKLTPPPVFHAELVYGPAISLCNKIGVDLGIYKILSSADKPMSLSELADATSAKAEFLRRILRLLTSVNIINEVAKDTYQASPVTRTLGQDGTQALTNHFWDEIQPTWSLAPTFFASHGYTSPPSSRATVFNRLYQTPLSWFEWKDAQPDGMANFNLAMTGSRNQSPHWTTWFPVRERLIEGFEDTATLLVDVGGGQGADLRMFLEAFPNVQRGQLVLQDLPMVVEELDELDERVVVQGHDFFAEQPLEGARAYFLGRVLHDWDDAKCEEILKRIVKAMQPHSRVLISENILPDTGASIMQAGLDLVMMTLHGGCERSESQWVDLLDAAGLQISEFFVNPGGGEGIVQAVTKQNDTKI